MPLTVRCNAPAPLGEKITFNCIPEIAGEKPKLKLLPGAELFIENGESADEQNSTLLVPEVAVSVTVVPATVVVPKLVT